MIRFPKWRFPQLSFRRPHPRPPIDILHISDLHLGAPNPGGGLAALESALAKIAWRASVPERFLVCSGDMTFQGSSSGLSDAQVFLSRVANSMKIVRQNIILCPGNHDLILKDMEPLRQYDALAYGVTRRADASFSSQPAVWVPGPDVGFLILNSACKLDPKYGFIDLSKVIKLLPDDSHMPKWRVAVLHHSLLGLFENDVSCVRNAYPLLKMLDDLRFAFIMHGHQHSYLDFPMGSSKIQVIGARTFNFHSSDCQTGFNHYLLDGDKCTLSAYVYLHDAFDGATMGSYVRTFHNTYSRSQNEI